MARTMLTHQNVPHSLWVEAILTIVHILNKSPTLSLARITPFEAYFSRKLDASIFLCLDVMLMLTFPRISRES